MQSFINNKVSKGLLRLIGKEKVRHFAKQPDIFFDEHSRDAYFKLFDTSQVLEISEVEHFKK